MIVFLLNVYLVILFLLVWFKIVPFNLFWKVSPLIVLLSLLVGLFIPMGWGAPSGPALVVRQSVQVVPDVAGEVIDVPVEPNRPIKAKDVLFKIDPVPFAAQVQALETQLKFAELRLEQMTQLHSRDAGRLFDVQQREPEVNQLRAQLEGAKWNLDKTVVRAPANGYVTNLALRKGARVSSLSVVGIAQINARYVAAGQPVEITFKFIPGVIHTGRVETVLEAIASGQVQPSGLAVTPKQIESAPFVVRVALDDAELARRLPAGATGEAAIFTDRVNPSHTIRRVMLRMTAFLNYVVPF
jgi:multidrug resistance efflux pump